MKGTAVFSAATRPDTRHWRSPNSGASRVAVAAAAFICLVTVTAGCSSSSSTPANSVTTTVTASPTTPAASTATATTGGSGPVSSPVACQTTSLQLKQGSPNGYAGGVYEVIDFTNTSTSPCTLYGYPGVSLVSGPPYPQIGLAAKRGTTTPVKLVTLAPGATAHAVLQIVDALNFPPSSCSPTKATYLRIYPPNQKTPGYVPTAAQGCAKPTQILYVSPVAPGP